MIRTRLGAEPDYIVTAQIISATAEDGSALDSGPGLDYCGSGEICTWQDTAKGTPAQGSTSPTTTNGTSAKGGAGSGGIFPGQGLPLNLPKIPQPAKWLIYAALFAGGMYVVNEAKRR